MNDKNKYKQIEGLIERGYDSKELKRIFGPKLHDAASVDDLSIARLLVNSKVDVDIRNKEYETPLYIAAYYDSYSVAKLLIDNGAEINGYSGKLVHKMPIHGAAVNWSLSTLRLLIDNGADVNSRDQYGYTPLHYVVDKDDLEWLGKGSNRLNNGDMIAIIDELISRGANVNAIGESLFATPLHTAVGSCLEGAIDILLTAGADKNILDGSGRKPEDRITGTRYIYDPDASCLGATYRLAIKKEAEIHIRALVRKKKQLIQTDDYGIKDRSRWDDELVYFVTYVLIPKLFTSKIYTKWVLRNSDAIAIIARTADVAIKQLAYHLDRETYRDDMNPIEYENMCAEILSNSGWSSRITSASGDQGVDVIAEKNGHSVVLQCKKYSSPVGNKAVQEAHAGKGFMGATTAAVVTNSSYTPSAKQLAASLGVLLLHHDELRELSNKLL